MPKVTYGSCIFGVDYSIPPHLLPSGFLPDAQNIVPTAAGLSRGRNGCVRLNSTAQASKITSFFEFRSGATRNQLCSYGEAIAYYDSGTGEFVDSITGLTEGKMHQWVNFAGKAICVNEGADPPQYWSAADTKGALAGTPPNGLTIAEWANRIWLGGDSTNVAKLSGCHLNDPTNWGTDGAIHGVSQTVGDSGDPIRGLYGFFDMLLVGKANAMFKVTGAPATDATSLDILPVYTKDSDSVGFTSPWAITQVGNDIIFLDGYDIKRLSGIQEYGDIETSSIIPHFRDYLKDTVSKDYLQYAQFFHYKKAQQIWVSIPKTATTYLVFCLDYKFKEDTKRYSFFPMAFAEELSCFGGVEDGELVNMYAGFEDGWVRKLDTGNDDDGTAIDRYFVQVFAGNDPQNGMTSGHENRKQFQVSDTFIKPDGTLSMTPYCALNLMDDAQVRTGSNYTALTAETVSGWSGTGTKNKRLRFFGLNGNTLALKWRHNTLGQNFTFAPSVLHFDWKSTARIV